MKVTVYSTGCPKCKQMLKKLDTVGIEYNIVTDTTVLVNLGFDTVPVIQVGEQFMNFAQAWAWATEVQKNGIKN